MGKDMIHDACILFVYHDKNELTIQNYKRFKKFNPEYPVVMMRHEDFPLMPEWDYDWMWGYNDNIWYRWFLSQNKILADRYFIFDYDTYCNDSIKNFYSKVWDKQFACSDHFSIDKYPTWSWFEKFKDQLKQYSSKLYGVCPPSGMMIRHDDAKKLIDEQLKNSQVWKKIFLELRIGTILNLNDVQISFIDENKKNYITPFSQSVPNTYKNVPGIYHPVKIKDYGNMLLDNNTNVYDDKIMMQKLNFNM
jgi:hypothetical protein